MMQPLGVDEDDNIFCFSIRYDRLQECFRSCSVRFPDDLVIGPRKNSYCDVEYNTESDSNSGSDVTEWSQLCSFGESENQAKVNSVFHHIMCGDVVKYDSSIPNRFVPTFDVTAVSCVIHWWDDMPSNTYFVDAYVTLDTNSARFFRVFATKCRDHYIFDPMLPHSCPL